MRFTLLLFAFFLAGSVAAVGQKIDSYIDTMRKALAPYGTITAPNCHLVEIDLNGPWGNYGVPTGEDKEHPGQYKWIIVQARSLRLFIDLADLDEDKVRSDMAFSLSYISAHKKGAPYVPDSPIVTLAASDLNHMTVHQLDLEKLKALQGQTKIPEDKFEFTVKEVGVALIEFSDEQHADYFQKAIQKAIVLCKAQ